MLLYCFIIAPKILWERFRGKKHPAFFQRLAFFLPTAPFKKVIWLHAVSVGEVKAAVPFFQLLKEQFPDSWFFVTTTTATGFDEAKRVLKAESTLFLPLDFSWIARRFVQKLRPDLFFLVEGDIWPNLLKEVKERGGKTFLVSGKMSIRSFLRMKRFSFLTRKLFAHLDLLCVQSEEYANRFAYFAPHKVRVTGNLKLDMRQEFVSASIENVITMSCTHAQEEEMLLEQILVGPWNIFLAPRHPERFNEVATLLSRKNIPFARLSENKKAKVILVDSMGKLATCYAKSQVAIIGGSFIPGVGGHNVLEPALYGCPSLFGPYVENQQVLVSHVLSSKAGLQISPTHILDAVHEIISNRKAYSQRSLEMVEQLKGAAFKTWKEIKHHI